MLSADRLQKYRLEQQQPASKLTKPQTVKKRGGGGLSPCNTEDDCFATCRSLDKDVARWVLKVASVDRWWRLG